MKMLLVALALLLAVGPATAKPATSVGGTAKKTGTIGGKPTVPASHATGR